MDFKEKSRKIMRNISHFLYIKSSSFPHCLMSKKTKSAMHFESGENKPRIAFVCDEMTWQDYHGICSGIFLHPATWKKQIEAFKPQMFFCESAWEGIEASKGAWRGQIYKDKTAHFENRATLLSIITYCKEKNIPTVFWNKEDPQYFRNGTYDFYSTALHFDFIFTTAEECVNIYKSMGHKHVSVLPFGVAKPFFNVDRNNAASNSAVFAGSWFSNYSNRCSSLSEMLDYVLDKGFKLDIFNRMYEKNKDRFVFPKQYDQYIRKNISYTDMPSLFSHYEYIINVNTVTKSSTMCSRRLMQALATGTTVISNSFAGLSKLSDIVSITKISDDIVLLKADPEKIRKSFDLEHQFDSMINTVLNDKAV